MKKNAKTWERRLKRIAARLKKLADTFESDELVEVSAQLLAIRSHPLDHSKVLQQKAIKGTFLEGATPLKPNGEETLHEQIEKGAHP